MNRAVSFFMLLAVFTLVFWAGSNVQLAEEEARTLLDEFSKITDGIDAFGIFAHNTTLALPMFLPGFGIAWGLFSALSTGIAFSAISQLTPGLDMPALSLLFLSPFGLMELTAYSLAISRSFLLALGIVRHRSITNQIRPLSMEVGIVLLLLLAGGYLEFYMLELAGAPFLADS